MLHLFTCLFIKGASPFTNLNGLDGSLYLNGSLIAVGLVFLTLELRPLYYLRYRFCCFSRANDHFSFHPFLTSEQVGTVLTSIANCYADTKTVENILLKKPVRVLVSSCMSSYVFPKRWHILMTLFLCD